MPRPTSPDLPRSVPETEMLRARSDALALWRAVVGEHRSDDPEALVAFFGRQAALRAAWVGNEDVLVTAILDTGFELLRRSAQSQPFAKAFHEMRADTLDQLDAAGRSVTTGESNVE